MSVLHVSCAAEGSYVPHSAAMLHSVLAHRGESDVQIHYLHGPDFDPAAREQLAGMIERNGGTVSFLGIPDEELRGLPTKGFTRRSTWYRIFLPELLPEVDRILYLDADVVVVDSLDPLWTTDVADRYLAAVTNVFEPYFRQRPAALGLDGPHAYFNAGVLLMNLEIMRRDGCSAALRDYATRHAGDLLWRDQDALNVVLGSRRVPLHPRWNCMNSMLLFPWSVDVFGETVLAQARRKPAIRHFEGPSFNKPWHYLCDHAMREVYFHHRRQTPWPRYRLEGRTAANVVRKLSRATRRRLRLRYKSLPATSSLLDRDSAGVVDPVEK